MGTSETAVAFTTVAAKHSCPDPAKVTTNVQVHRSGDLLDYIRQVLMGHQGHSAPQCIMGNYLERCPGKLQTMCRKLDASAKTKAGKLEAKGQNANSV